MLIILLLLLLLLLVILVIGPWGGSWSGGAGYRVGPGPQPGAI